MAAARKPAAKPTEKLAAAVAHTSLSPEVLRELRRPFSVAAIRFKPQTVSKDKSKAMGTFYIDARLVAERFNDVVGPENWHPSYHVLFEANPQAHGAAHFPVECSLTVFGVTKADVGVYQKSKADNLAMKSSYSDALKRAAVLFGVGAVLYTCPKIWAPTKTYTAANGEVKVDGFSPTGEQTLRLAYSKHIASPEILGYFGEALDHGDVMPDPDLEAEPEPDPQPEPEPKQSGPELVTDKEEISRLVALAEQAGIERDAALKLCKAEKDEHGGYRRAWVTEQLQFLKGLIEDKAKAAA